MFRIRLVIFLIITAAFCGIAIAQTTTFTYQGNLTDGAVPANGNYQMKFSLFDAVSGGNQIGTTITFDTVNASGGAFNVNLNFAAPNALDGSPRWVEIAVKKPADPGFTTLAPRQPVSSTPYSVRSLNASNADIATFAVNAASSTNATHLGSVPANQFVLTTDPRMTDSRTPTAGSGSYIQNGTSQQSSSNFNVSGTGTASIFTATTQFNIGDQRVVSTPGLGNTFVGAGAGIANTQGTSNTFLGNNAGNTNQTGSFNTIIGDDADVDRENLINATAIGHKAWVSQSNSIVLGSIVATNGASANTNVGIGTTFPQERLMVAGSGDIRVRIDGGNSAALSLNAISQPGWFLEAFSGSNNFRFFNRRLSQNVIWIDGSNSNVGIGTNAPAFKLDVVDRIRLRQNSPSTGSANTAGIWLFQNTPNADRAFIGMETDNSVGFFGNNGGGWSLVMNTQTGVASVRNLGSAGSTSLCLNASNEISTCSSSLRYKQDINSFNFGLALIDRLRPVSFNWKEGGAPDLGLVAEEVAEVEPLLVTRNDKGEIEGVKYDRLGVVLINVVKEQQEQINRQMELIDRQQEQINRQHEQIDVLRKIVCTLKPGVEICK